jgi:hypothetical protein
MSNVFSTAIKSSAAVAFVSVPLYILRRPILLATTVLVAGSFLTPIRGDIMEIYRDRSARSQATDMRRLETQERLETLRLQNEATRIRLESDRAAQQAERAAKTEATARAAQRAAQRVQAATRQENTAQADNDIARQRAERVRAERDLADRQAAERYTAFMADRAAALRADAQRRVENYTATNRLDTSAYNLCIQRYSDVDFCTRTTALSR